MKELIVILLIIFASLAFGAEPGGEIQSIINPKSKIQLPYNYDKEIPGVGKVHTELHNGPAIDEMTMDVYVGCYDKSGNLGKMQLVDQQKICEYSSEIYDTNGHLFKFQFRKSLILGPGPSQCNSDDRMSCFSLTRVCENLPPDPRCLIKPPQGK